jgi:hypothetical protein
MNFDIDNFTLGQLKQIAALVNNQIAPASSSAQSSAAHPFVGKYCIARCYAAGVHAGTVVSVDGDTCVLSDSNRLWSWKAQDGVALSGVAQTGVKSGCKIDTQNPEIYLTGVCELIPCSAAAKESINAYKK